MLGRGEALEVLGEVLDHVVALGLAVHQYVESDLLLQRNDIGDLGAHRGDVSRLVDLAPA